MYIEHDGGIGRSSNSSIILKTPFKNVLKKSKTLFRNRKWFVQFSFF